MCGRGFASLALFPLRFNHALPTDSPRMTGATRSACAAQNRARRFGAKRVCPESAALDFPPPAGVAPYPMREGQHRARPTGESARVSPRAAYASLRLFSRQLGLNGDAAGTLCAGRENRSPVHWGRGGTMTVARVDDGRGAVGCLWRGGSIGPLGSLVSIGSVSIGKRR